MTDPHKIQAAIELSQFIEDRLRQTALLFASEAEHTRSFHDESAKTAKGWRRQSTCMFPGCSHKTIAASHTLQRAGPIYALLEGDHVYTPRSYKGVLSLVKVGASEASTFPGYCSQHERLFASFEIKRTIENGNELDLQIYRTLCREIRRKEHDVARMETLANDLKAKLDKAVRAQAKRLGVELKSFSYEGMNLNAADDFIANGRQVLTELQAMHTALHPAIDRSGASGLDGIGLNVPLAFPVALSGMANLPTPAGGAMVLIGVIPQGPSTLIFMAGPAGTQAAIERHMVLHRDRLPLIDMIERWMVRGTDHWFLRPSVWDAIPQHRCDALLLAMQDVSSGLNAPLASSILDDMRRQAAAAAVPPPPAVLSQQVQAYLAEQLSRIT